MNTKAFLAAVAILLIFGSATSGIVIYYVGVLDEKNSKIIHSTIK